MNNNTDNRKQPPLQTKPSLGGSAVNDSETLCSKHKRRMEVICLDCNEIQCPKCAQFGEHKGHDFREIGEVIKEIASRAEKILEHFTGIELKEKELCGQTKMKEIMGPCIYLNFSGWIPILSSIF